MIVSDRPGSVVSLVNCSAIVAIPVTANDPNIQDRWDRIRVYLCDRRD